MPELNWKEIAELKHSLSEERVIICGVITRLKRLDERLETFESNLVKIIESSGEEETND